MSKSLLQYLRSDTRVSLCRYFKYLRRLRVFETLASAVNVRYEGDIRAIARSSSQEKSCSPISAVALFATRQPQKRARKLLARLSFFLPRPSRPVSLCIGSRWMSRLLCSLVYLARGLPPLRLPLVLYVFLKVDKPDAIASLFAENFLGKYARIRHSLEPLGTRRNRLSRSSLVSFWSRTTDRTEDVEISDARKQQTRRKSWYN